MQNLNPKARLMGDLEAAATEMLHGMLETRGRGFASAREAWEELKEKIETNEKLAKNVKKLHDEMWDAVKDKNEDAFAALACEFERSAASLVTEWAETRVMAKIAVEMTEG